MSRPKSPRPVYIAQACAVTALGPTLAATQAALMEGGSGIVRLDRFDTRPHVSPWAALIPALGNHGLAPGETRIFDLARALMDQLSPLPASSCVLTATTKAGVDALAAHTRPPKGILPSDLPGFMARELNEKWETDQIRAGVNISAACTSSALALARGADLIASGREDCVLVAGMDLVSEFVFSGFSALGAMSPDPARPFDQGRQGLTLGEAAAGLVLMDETTLTATGTRPLARLSGWGGANDAHHLTAPARDGAGLKQAIAQALDRAGLAPQAMGAVNTHGTGTQYNDQMELVVHTDLFPALPANSVKGATGHTLGAAGALEAALCTLWCNHGHLPGTHGLSTPESQAEESFSPRPRTFTPGPVLTTTSGFGGINAALIIEPVTDSALLPPEPGTGAENITPKSPTEAP